MIEGDRPGMKCDAAILLATTSAVLDITLDRMSCRSKLRTDLVECSAVGHDFHQRVPIADCQHSHGDTRLLS